MSAITINSTKPITIQLPNTNKQYSIQSTIDYLKESEKDHDEPEIGRMLFVSERNYKKLLNVIDSYERNKKNQRKSGGDNEKQSSKGGRRIDPYLQVLSLAFMTINFKAMRNMKEKTAIIADYDPEMIRKGFVPKISDGESK